MEVKSSPYTILSLTLVEFIVLVYEHIYYPDSCVLLYLANLLEFDFYINSLVFVMSNSEISILTNPTKKLFHHKL